jgi:prephenate dehydratase
MKRVAMLGPGTFSEEATRYLLTDEQYEFVYFKLITEVFQATAGGLTDWSVIPIENTIEGSVSLHVDLLVHEYDLPIQAEWVYPISMSLIGYRADLREDDADNPTAKYANIKKVVSYSPAFTQCRHFLRTYLPDAELEQVTSTAEGAAYVKRCKPGDGVAAIGNVMAARLNELDVLAERIEDHQNNFTRFILWGPHPLEHSGASSTKTSILVTLPEDYPGALHQVLSAFAWRRINLSKIESRPTKKKLGNYYFYIDIEASMDSVLLPAAISEIEAIGCQVRVLGSYPTYSYTANSEV